MSDEITRIESVSRSRVTYLLHSSALNPMWDAAYRATNRPLSQYLGEVQGGWDRETPVGLKDIGDFCASFARYVVNAAELTVDQGRALLWFVPEMPSADAIQFALTLKHKPGKATYFNLQQRKVSSRAALEHDKRWTRITEGYNGSVASAMRVLLPYKEHDPVFNLELWLVRQAIWDTCSDFSPPNAVYFELIDQYADGYAAMDSSIRWGVSAFRNAVASIRQRWHAQTDIACFEQSRATFERLTSVSKELAASEAGGGQ